MGAATALMAAADPGRDYLAVEAHLPGVAQLLVLSETLGLTNVRVAFADAVELLTDAIAPSSLDALHIFFPDPWPKARHHKRRLVQPSRVELLRSRLVPNGTIHCATDWAPYAEVMLAAFAADAELVNPFRGPAPRPAHRPVTRFEQRALDAGRPIIDIVVRRTAPATG
jgi:tRNA (guanine-N7-)-methyltransferase